MALTFPTIAERTLEQWRSLPGTHPLETTARKNGGVRADEKGPNGRKIIIWQFDDESRLEATGSGVSYKVSAELP